MYDLARLRHLPDRKRIHLRFIKRPRRGWLYQRHRHGVVPAGGTAISATNGGQRHRPRGHVGVGRPARHRPGEALVIWTTTPWTLPANVAAAVQPDADYGRLPGGDWLAVSRGGATATFAETKKGRELVGWTYRGPFDALGPGGEVEHRVIAWDEVSMDEGTGIVHIAPGCGSEDFELSRVENLSVLTPVDEAGRFFEAYGWLSGRGAHRGGTTTNPREDLRKRELLVDAPHDHATATRVLALPHAAVFFSHLRRLVHRGREIRQPMRDANATVECARLLKGLADGRTGSSTWRHCNISRRRYYGLPLRSTRVARRPHSRSSGHAPTGRDGHRAARRTSKSAAAVRSIASTSPCPESVMSLRSITEVGDVWLALASSLSRRWGWQNPTYVEEGYATGAAKGLTKADLPDHAYWEQWYPADWVSEMREQIRLWFYSQLFMSVALTGQAPYRKVLGYEKLLDESGREMHGSRGNMIDADEAFARMGADVMRWQYCMHRDQNLLFVRRRQEAAQVLTLWTRRRSSRVRQSSGSRRRMRSGGTRRPSWPSRRWIVARIRQLIVDATDGYERYLTVDVLRAFEAYVDDLSNWYVRRSRRRFWADDEVALRVLWSSLVNALRVVAPVMPFLTEHLWQILVRDVLPDAPPSIFLAEWPAAGEIDNALLSEMATMREVVELGRRARTEAQIRNRQPLHRLVVEGADAASPHADEIAEELRVKAVEFGPIEATELRVRPNLKVLGPRLGSDLFKCARRWMPASSKRRRRCFRLRDMTQRRRVLVSRTEKEGWAVVSNLG